VISIAWNRMGDAPTRTLQSWAVPNEVVLRSDRLVKGQKSLQIAVMLVPPLEMTESTFRTQHSRKCSSA
jgi:hypothetical protein